VKRLALVIALLLATHTALAQGSKYRAAYEKEKNGPHGECPIDWDTMQSGIDYRTIRCLGDTGDLDLHVVRIDLKKWKLDTAVVNGATARTIASQNDAPFALNTNFFDAARRPLGVVVKSGESVYKPRESTWQSIFYVTESGRARIVMPSKWSSVRKNAWMAVQAGPRLVVDGHTNSVKNNYAAPRAGVCIQWDEDVLFFATPPDRKLHIKEIAKVARRAEIDGGLACKDAMLFDGGHSVNLFVDGPSRDVSINQDPVPVYVYATER
jgi:uncharacterized protein YigE (DUF2233 family)